MKRFILSITLLLATFGMAVGQVSFDPNATYAIKSGDQYLTTTESTETSSDPNYSKAYITSTTPEYFYITGNTTDGWKIKSASSGKWFGWAVNSAGSVWNTHNVESVWDITAVNGGYINRHGTTKGIKVENNKTFHDATGTTRATFTFILNENEVEVEENPTSYQRYFKQSAGTWTSTNAAGSWAAAYQTSATGPYMTVSCPQNNMAWDTNGDPKLYTGSVTPRNTTWTIAVEDGYELTDVSFNTSKIDNQATTVTIQGGTAVSSPGTVEAHNINEQTITFTVQTTADNKGVLLTNFVATIVKSTKPLTKQTIFVYDKSSAHNVIYRIPSIASISTGTYKNRIVAITDYRTGTGSQTDVGQAEVSIHAKYSDNFGLTWSDEIEVVRGQWGVGTDTRKYSYGDAVSIADRESGKILMVSCSGNVSYPNATRNNHQGVETYYSEDGGATWTAPVDVSEQIYTQLDAIGIQSLFVGSGGFTQSKFIKKGAYYRVYGGILCRTSSGSGINYTIYTDDFGATWHLLGSSATPSITSGGDEAKVEELPDGSVLHSSRATGGRIFNIWRWTDDSFTSGAWDGQVNSNSSNSGVVATNNGTNGEILIVPAKRTSDNKCVYLAMQSIPFGSGRANVGIYWKELASAADFDSTTKFAANWTKGYQASYLNSAYSAMVLQEDGNIGFMVEEETTSGCPYSQVYHNLSYAKITGSDLYTFKSDNDADFDKSAFITQRQNITLKYVNKDTDEQIGDVETHDNVRVGSPVLALATARAGFYPVECSPSVVTSGVSLYIVKCTDVDYSVNYQNEKITHASRKTSSVSLTYDGVAHTISGLQSDSDKSLYWDKTSEVFTCSPNTEITPSVGSMSWMHAYAYVDTDHDGFAYDGTDIASRNFAKIAVICPDLKSYTFFSPTGTSSGFNSKGATTQNSGGTANMPSFNAPSAPGSYRVRLKIDWNNIDPKGNTSTGNTITANGGIIVDFTLQVNASKDNLTSLLNAIPTTITNVGVVGGYTAEGASALETAAAQARTVAAKASPTQDEINAAYADLQTALVPDFLPQPGHFYRLQGGSSSKYITVESVPTESNLTNAPLSTATDATTIFFLEEGGYLLNYKHGVYLAETREVVKVGGTKHPYTFASSTLQLSNKGMPYLTIFDAKASTTNGSWLYDNTTKADRNSTYVANNCEWKVTEVTQLPVTIGSTGFATVNLPVPTIIPDDVEAWVASTEADNERISITRIKDGILPANCAVILYTNNPGEKLFDTNTTASGTATSAFDGTTAATLRTSDNIFVLGNDATSGVGLYSYTGDYIPGFKLYYVNAATTGNNIRLQWNEMTTTIQAAHDTSLRDGITYNLNGHRVTKAQGLVIINGKKVVIR